MSSRGCPRRGTERQRYARASSTLSLGPLRGRHFLKFSNKSFNRWFIWLPLFLRSLWSVLATLFHLEFDVFQLLWRVVVWQSIFTNSKEMEQNGASGVFIGSRISIYISFNKVTILLCYRVKQNWQRRISAGNRCAYPSKERGRLELRWRVGYDSDWDRIRSVSGGSIICSRAPTRGSPLRSVSTGTPRAPAANWWVRITLPPFSAVYFSLLITFLFFSFGQTSLFIYFKQFLLNGVTKFTKGHHPWQNFENSLDICP